MCFDDEERAPNFANLVFQMNTTNLGDIVDVMVLLKISTVSPGLPCTEYKLDSKPCLLLDQMKGDRAG